MSLTPLLEVALNGSQGHPRVPKTPGQLADEARAAVEAGARVIHMHAFDDGGRETLAAAPSAAALDAVRRACPGVPISLSTSAAIAPDPRRRVALVSGWTVLPELVTANQGEDGIIELCELLIARGIGIEAGLLSADEPESSSGRDSSIGACASWSSRSMPTLTTPWPTRLLWRRSSPGRASSGNKFTTATESPAGR
jgi:uncharacterized protein (DUF849 family)